MYKMLIADDEPKIRRGLSKLNWESLNIQIVAEASNGREAYIKTEEFKPDLILLDINMPVMNGLELIRKLHDTHHTSVIIVVSGYDDFEYAREALKYNVFDYVLKPVNRKVLFEAVEKGIGHLEDQRKKDKLVQWVYQQVLSEHEMLIKNFFGKWVSGGIKVDEAIRNLDVLSIDFSIYKKAMFLRVLPIRESSAKVLEGDLLEFAIKNIILETTDVMDDVLIVKTESDLFLVLYAVSPGADIQMASEIKGNISRFLNLHTQIIDGELPDSIEAFPGYYLDQMVKVKEESKLSPVLQMAKEYIESNYGNPYLSIEDASKHARVSTSYLTKIFKKEMNCSYTDFVTKVRVDNAIKLMADPLLRIYDIAEKVGYSTQHYFSAAFKKEIGMSPAKYRKDKYQNE